MTRARRQRSPASLELHRGAGDAVELAEEVYVIQTPALSDVTRLVLLFGDPTQPFDRRAGRATVEVKHGHTPDEDTRALIDDLLTVLETHGRTYWTRELEKVAERRRRHMKSLL